MNNLGKPDLIQQEMEFASQADRLIRDLGTYGMAKANAEHDYKVAMSETALQMKAGGIPATLINTVIHGYGDVAKLRLKRDIAESQYEVVKESINLLKYQIKIVENQINREWGRSGE